VNYRPKESPSGWLAFINWCAVIVPSMGGMNASLLILALSCASAQIYQGLINRVIGQVLFRPGFHLSGYGVYRDRYGVASPPE